MLLEMQRVECRHKASRHKPLFQETFCTLKKEIHFLIISFSLGLWIFSFSSGDLHSPPFRIAHDFDKKTPWQHKVEKGTRLNTVFMPRKMSPKTLSKHSIPWYLCAFGRKMGREVQDETKNHS